MEIEPLLLVIFHQMTGKKVAKNNLSFVSHSFFRFLKCNYRSIPRLAAVISGILAISQAVDELVLSTNNGFGLQAGTSDLQITASFLQFMVYNLCDSLTDEHTKFMFTLVNRVDYGKEENVDKFKQEILLFNELAAVLSHWQFDQCRFHAQKAMKEIRRNEKRLCEICDIKIERAEELKWARSSGSMLQRGFS